MTRRRLPRVAFGALVVLLYVFLLAPIAVVVIASLNAGRFLVFPPEGLSLQWYAKFARSGPFVRSFSFSLRLAAVTTAISTVVGTAAALYVVRRARRSSLLRLLMVAPLQLPGIMTALALRSSTTRSGSAAAATPASSWGTCSSACPTSS